MCPFIHRVKEQAERACGMHLSVQRRWPFVNAQRRFLTVRMDLHNKCNLRCSMCYFSIPQIFGAPLVEMSERALERLGREVFPRTRELWLSCSSEPLIGRQLPQALELARQAAVPLVQLVTNGLALTEDKARLLIQSGLHRLNLSFDGATKETYEQIRVGSHYERVLENIKRLNQIKQELGSTTPRLTMLTVMMLKNMNEWEGLAHLAADLGCDRLELRPQTYYTEFEENERLCHYREQVNRQLERAIAAARQRGLDLETPPLFTTNPPAASGGCAQAPGGPATRARACVTCYLPWMQVVAYPDGQLLPCTPMRHNETFGNLNEQSFSQIFYGRQFRQLRESLRQGQHHATCAQCPACRPYNINNPDLFNSKDIF